MRDWFDDDQTISQIQDCKLSRLTSNRWIAHRLRLGEEVPEGFDTSGTGGLDPRPTLRLEIYVSHYRESIKLR